MDHTKTGSSETPNRGESDAARGPKKPYSTPTLVRWGAIENLTRGAGNLGDPDGTFQSQTGT